MGTEVFAQGFCDVKHEVQVVGHYDGGTNAEGRHFYGQESKLAGNGFAERGQGEGDIGEVCEGKGGVCEGDV